MLQNVWRRVLRPAVMRDADRLISAHGRGAYGMARIGATASHDTDGTGHWSEVAREIARRWRLEAEGSHTRDASSE